MFRIIKKFTTVLLSIMLLFFGVHGVGADVLEYTDGLSVIAGNEINFGNVEVGVSKTVSVQLRIQRRGNSDKDVFIGGSESIISVSFGSILSPLALETVKNTIELPSNWRTLSNNTLSSDYVSFKLTVIPTEIGEKSQVVQFSATGKNYEDPTKPFTVNENITVRWNGYSTTPVDNQAPTGSILINSDAEFTNNQNVILSLSALDNIAVTGYRIALGNDASEAATVAVDPGVTPFSLDVPFELPVGDATKSVAVQYRDKDGNWSDNYVDSIVLDQTKPTLVWGTPVSLPNLKGWNNSEVSLSFTVDDNLSGVDSVSKLSPIVFDLEGANQSVKVVVTDKAGNSAEFTSAVFNLDFTKPTGSILINGGAIYTNKLDVLLALLASDINGIVAYQINGGDIIEVDPAQNEFDKDFDFTLSAGDGVKTVSIKYKDIADNWSELYEDTIILDQTAPSGSILINGTALYTKDLSVKLSLNANDNYEVVAYRIANGEDASLGVEVAIMSTDDFSKVVDWDLPSGDGVKKVSVQYKDAAGNWSENFTDEITLDQTAPELTFGAFNPTANIYGWNNTDVSLSFSTYDATSGVATVFPESPYVFTAEGAGQTVKVKVTDHAGNEAEFTSGAVNIDKTAPTINSVSVTPGLVPVGTVVTFSVDAFDELAGLAKIEYRMDGGNWFVMVGGVASFTPEAAYVHEIEFRVTDKADNVTMSDKQLLVVFDPDGGFVTGGGWIMSPQGAYAKDPTLTGKANFGFVSKYLKGANVPTGNTQFVFSAGGLNFHSTSYEWLVISGSKAQYKGYGVLNGESGYQFMLTATDGSVDLFRIKIWKTSTGEIIYDNQMGSSDSSELTTQLGGGSIVIHVPPKKR